MDFNITTLTLNDVVEGLFIGTLYDVFKLLLALIFLKFLYEKFYMQRKWGGWKIKVLNSADKEFEGTERVLTPSKARAILEDDGEFSIYVKGIVASTNSWLNVDIASKKAKKIELVKRDDIQRVICIDLANNRPPKPSVKFSKKTQEQIDHIESMIRELKEEIHQDT